MRRALTPLSHRSGNITLRARFNLNIDHHGLADAGDGFSGWSKHQIEVKPCDRIGRHRPARPSSFINRGQQFDVKRDWLRHAVYC